MAALPVRRVETVADAIAEMRGIDEALPADDGVACFNSMYLKVTEAVEAKLDQGSFADYEFMDRLDVNFAKLYLGAYDAYEVGEGPSVCASWRTLFDRRDRDRILPLQYALAGMNAHINHDLPVALTTTCEELGRTPTTAGVFEDFVAVNGILAEADDAVRAELQGKVADTLDDVCGPLDDAIGSWGIARARGAAWRQGLRLWELREEQNEHGKFLHHLDRLVALTGRFLLAPVTDGNETSHRLLRSALAAIDEFGDRAGRGLWGDGVVDGDDDGVLGTLLWESRQLDDRLERLLWGDGDLDGVGDGVAGTILHRWRRMRGGPDQV